MYKIVTKGVTVDMTPKKRDAYASFLGSSVGTQLFKLEDQGRIVTLVDVIRPTVKGASPAAGA